MSSGSRESLVRDFRERSGADERRARFFLEAESWDLELALYTYFLNDGSSEEASNAIPQVPTVETVALSDSDPELVPDEADVEESKYNPSSVTIKKKSKSKNNTNSKFATLQNLMQDSSSDEEEGQAFYAGGSVRSGQQIIGPGKNKDAIIADMFRSVKEHGGLIVNPDGEASSSSSHFTGTGYKLGATQDDTTVVPDPNVAKNKKFDPENVAVLRFWRNGFSLDGGDLRPYSDPDNAQFLEHVRRGEIPPELRGDSEVYLTMEDRKNEDFSRTTIGPAKPFQGKGQILGSPAPAIAGSTAIQTVGTKDQEASQVSAQVALKINEDEPTTNIQFRLADGSRISGRFNHTHTIANLREYITNAVPIYQLQTFVLLTTFPNKELSDLNQTIKEAGLLNALVVQRLK